MLLVLLHLEDHCAYHAKLLEVQQPFHGVFKKSNRCIKMRGRGERERERERERTSIGVKRGIVIKRGRWAGGGV